VKKAVQEACPEITEIRQVRGLGGGAESGVRFTSPFALGAKGGWLFRRRCPTFPKAPCGRSPPEKTRDWKSFDGATGGSV
jgi:hypothetical protein